MIIMWPKAQQRSEKLYYFGEIGRMIDDYCGDYTGNGTHVCTVRI